MRSSTPLQGARGQAPGPESREASRGQNTPHPGERPAPLLEVRPQGQPERHTEVGFELVLDPVVPQMAEKLVEVVDVPAQGGFGLRGGLQGPGPGQGLPVQVEYISPAPAVFLSSTPLVEHVAPAPAVISSPEPVVEYTAPAPAMIPAPVPVVEYLAPAPAMFPAPAKVVEYTSLVPAVFPAPAPAEEYISPAPAGFHGSTAFLGTERVRHHDFVQDLLGLAVMKDLVEVLTDLSQDKVRRRLEQVPYRAQALGSGRSMSRSWRLGSSSSRRPPPCASSVAASGLDEAVELPGCCGTPKVSSHSSCETPAQRSVATACSSTLRFALLSAS